ncbi:hypothetical protein quinque_011556 [Culex quinquefasciatus]|uniref:uncharacterized protein LOC6033317 n=1 Tax=Culex quinquefasciatus TaxID=7176 RepID=UPI0018E324F5|nr:uncharacterized protein LOC6033317 [Culex quinquefasciatus]
MAIAFKLYLLAVLVGVVASHTAVTPQLVVEREEHDQDVIQKTLDEIRQRSSVQFMEYGPDAKEGYKYHLSVGDELDYVIHTDKPIIIPIVETIKSTRAETDRKLLERLIASGSIKSLDSVKRKQ